MYLGLLLSGLSLIVGFFKNFGIVIVFSIAEGGQSSQHSNIFAGLRWSQFFGLLYSIQKTNVETGTHYCLTEWHILKTCFSCHLCLKSGLVSEKSPLLPHTSRKWAYFCKLASVATSVQKVGLFLPKTCICCHFCPESGLNQLCRWFISLKFKDTKTLGLKLM